MLSIGLWRRYVNITITTLDIIQRPVFDFKHNISETEFCPRLQVKTTKTGTSSISWAELNKFHLKMETESILSGYMWSKKSLVDVEYHLKTQFYMGKYCIKVRARMKV
jgi:hypothetical protein